MRGVTEVTDILPQASRQWFDAFVLAGAMETVLENDEIVRCKVRVEICTSQAKPAVVSKTAGAFRVPIPPGTPTCTRLGRLESSPDVSAYPRLSRWAHHAQVLFVFNAWTLYTG